jgi:hypothetical protein
MQKAEPGAQQNGAIRGTGFSTTAAPKIRFGVVEEINSNIPISVC